MSSAEKINFDNHKDKCRCCFRSFEIEDMQIKVTEIVKIRFQEITQIEASRVLQI